MRIRIKNWPFKKGKKVQLIWIGEPFKYNNKWMIDTYFNDENKIERVIQDWANIHFLSIYKYYTDGDLNSGEIIDKYRVMEIIDIDLSNIIPKYNENNWRIRNSNYISESRTFNFYKNNILYSIPVVEIVRSVLAPNSFMLNTILYNDILEDYYTYEINDSTLRLYFHNTYKRSYLKDGYYNHLAWIIGNKEVLDMVSDIGYNSSINNKMIFNFNMSSFKFKARVKKNKIGYTVLEIISVKGKEIKFNELNIYHPSFEDQKSSNKTKIRTYINLNKDSDRIIDDGLNASAKSDESIEEDLIIHEYINIPKVKKEKTGCINKRTKEDINTKQYIKEDDKRRTLADEGGINVIKGLEVSNVDLEMVNGELREFIEVLNLLRNMNGIKSVEIKVAELPLGRKFSYLSDGITRRRCVIATVFNYKNIEYKIIEVERDGRSISTLILSSINYNNYLKVYNIILRGLVNESGRWNIEVLKSLDNENIVVKRHKHIKNSVDIKMKKIFKKLI